MPTRYFIEKIRYYFNELNIKAKNGISFADFKHKAIRTLNRSAELGDAKLAVSYIKYCISHWKKIENIFIKQLDKWQEYEIEEPVNIQQILDEDAEGIYYITNALSSFSNRFYLTSSSINDQNILAYPCKDGFSFEDTDYYIRLNGKTSIKVELFNKNTPAPLCTITFDDNNNPTLKYNHTRFELVSYKDDEQSFIGVFDKSYIHSLKDDDNIEFENMVAEIEWDVLKAKNDQGIAKVILYEDLDDVDQIFYFALSSFLLYRSLLSLIKTERLKTAMTFIWLRGITRNLIG